MVSARARGFTVVEVLVVMAVFAIVAGLAGPALSEMVANQQVRAAAYDLHAALTIARSEALTRNSAVTVAPVGGDWARGWSLTEAGGTVLRRQNAYPRVSLSGPSQVIFSGDGRPDSTATPFGITSSGASATSYRCVRLRLAGRPAIDKGAC
ncbi:MAG TPA: GspH/FimT family protein [Burkholderiales bacterium]|nr:GspH/FimT family protein [Burkholderiales bacterium]